MSKKFYNGNVIFERWFIQLKSHPLNKCKRRFYRNEWRSFFLKGLTPEQSITALQKLGEK